MALVTANQFQLTPDIGRAISQGLNVGQQFQRGQQLNTQFNQQQQDRTESQDKQAQFSILQMPRALTS